MHRCLYQPRIVTPTPTPEMVVVRVPTETPDTYFEMKMTPEEAADFALELLLDSRRAMTYRAREEWLGKRIA